jgi:hypothetical protein
VFGALANASASMRALTRARLASAHGHMLLLHTPPGGVRRIRALRAHAHSAGGLDGVGSDVSGGPTAIA